MSATDVVAAFAVENGAMIGRSVRRSSRDLETLVTSVMLPVALMLMFVYVFGGAIDLGTSYVNYVVPGILLLTAAFGSATTAVSVSADMTDGIVDRFRAMPIAGSSVLTGHVVASLLRNLMAMVIVIGVALLVGWRPTASPVEWAGAAALLALFILSVSWLSACLGLVAGSPEAANAFTFVILFVPYVSSAFVPTRTMPAVLQGFADHQPVTPVIETLRSLLMGVPSSGSASAALAWLLVLLAASWVASSHLFRRRASR